LRVADCGSRIGLPGFADAALSDEPSRAAGLAGKDDRYSHA